MVSTSRSAEPSWPATSSPTRATAKGDRSTRRGRTRLLPTELTARGREDAGVGDEGALNRTGTAQPPNGGSFLTPAVGHGLSRSLTAGKGKRLVALAAFGVSFSL
jgi:hypothetical protein